MSIRKFVVASLFGAGLAASAPGHAALLFQDSFDTDSATSVLNFAGLTNWTVSGGTIDYIRNGGFGISCVGGSGGCLDMDGSTGDAGRITSTATFNLTAGTLYTLSAQMSGNQRFSGSDQVSFGLIDTATNTTFAFATVTSIATDPFSARNFGVISGSSRTVRLYFEGLGGDNLGMILDNVTFSDDTTAGVAEPGTLLLVGLGLLGAALRRRRSNA